MKHALVASAALAAMLSLSAVAPVAAAEKGKEKCYGIAKAGQNDCANLQGTHSCQGEAKTDNDPGDWKLVARGTCKQLGGLSADEAKKKIAAK